MVGQEWGQLPYQRHDHFDHPQMLAQEQCVQERQFQVQVQEWV